MPRKSVGIEYPAGVELPQETTGKQGVGKQSGAECGAVSSQDALAAVLDGWPSLTAADRQRILLIVEGRPDRW